MSEGPDKDQRTEAPTDKRRRDAAEQGDLLQSKELGTAAVMLAGAIWPARSSRATSPCAWSAQSWCRCSLCSP